MKKILVIVSVLLVLVACAAPPTNRDVSSDANTNRAPAAAAPLTEAEAIAKEESVWETLKKKDYDTFAGMLTSDYIEIGSDGVYDKAGIVSYVKDLELTDLSFADWKLVPIDKDANLLLYSVTIKGKFKGEEFPPGPYHSATGWVNRDGKWQALYYQQSLAGKSPPPPTAADAPAATTTPASQTAEASLPADPVEREKMVWDLLKRKDYDAFASVLDDAQIEVSPEGVNDKAGTLRSVRNFDASKVELSDFKSTRLSDNASLVTYMVEIPGAKPERGRAASIWRNTGGKWRALYHHHSPVSTPDAAASPAK